MADAARVICASEALAERGKGVRFTVEYQGESRPAFAIRYDGRAYAYLNSARTSRSNWTGWKVSFSTIPSYT